MPNQILSLFILTSLHFSGMVLAGQSQPQSLDIRFVSSVLHKSRVLKESGGKTLGHMAMIFERTAEQIEDSDLAYIDSRAIDWALDVAVRLRNVGLMFRDVGMIASVYGDQTSVEVGSFFLGYYHAFWTRTFRFNYARRVATYDAARFKFEQYNEIRTSGVRLQRDLAAKLSD